MDTIEAGKPKKPARRAAEGHRATSTRLHLEKHVVRTLTGQELGAVAGGLGSRGSPQPQSIR
jgi:hypothetical protein